MRKGRNLLRKIKGHFKQPEPIQPFSFLTNLPPELVHAITTFLETPEFCSLRLTCRKIYASTRGYFVRSYLHTVRTNLSLTALQRLQDLSQNPDLAPLVQKLVVKGRPEDDDFFGQGIVWERQHPSGHLSIPQKGIQQWQDVLRRLVHCRSFQLYRNESYEIDNTGGLLTAGDALTLILGIIIEIQIPVVAFSVDFQHGLAVDFIHMGRNNTSAVRRPEFITTWSGVQELSLNPILQPATTADWVFQLVQHARSLRKLQIDFGLGDETASFMHRLSYAELPFHLQEVTLGSMSQISGESLAQSLMRFLCRYCDSLRRIYLKAIFLEEGDCVAVLRCLRESEFSALEEINIFHLRDGDKGLHFPGVSENPIVDEEQGTEFTHFSVKKRGGRRNIGVCYSGAKMDVVLRRLVDWARFY